MEANEIQDTILPQIDKYVSFLFEFAKGNNDLAIIDFFMKFMKILKTDQSIQNQITFQNIHSIVMESVFYLCHYHDIHLSPSQKLLLKSTLHKLIYILEDDILMTNLNKSRFKLW